MGRAALLVWPVIAGCVGCIAPALPRPALGTNRAFRLGVGASYAHSRARASLTTPEGQRLDASGNSQPVASLGFIDDDFGAYNHALTSIAMRWQAAPNWDAGLALTGAVVDVDGRGRLPGRASFLAASFGLRQVWIGTDPGEDAGTGFGGVGGARTGLDWNTPRWGDDDGYLRPLVGLDLTLGTEVHRLPVDAEVHTIVFRRSELRAVPTVGVEGSLGGPYLIVAARPHAVLAHGDGARYGCTGCDTTLDFQHAFGFDLFAIVGIATDLRGAP